MQVPKLDLQVAQQTSACAFEDSCDPETPCASKFQSAKSHGLRLIVSSRGEDLGLLGRDGPRPKAFGHGSKPKSHPQ